MTLTPMADTSELLPREDIARLLWRTPHDYYSFDNASPRAKAVVYAQSDAVIAYAKSRLQAEAPTDAEVAKIEARQLAAEQPPRWDDDHANEPTVSRSAWEMACKDRRTLLAKLRALLAEVEEHRLFRFACDEEIAKLRARTSQAEAQAPTTAASVLTEDERHIVQFVRNVVNGPCPSVIADHQVRHLLRIIDRLTVGAPAPAPTTWTPIETAPKTGADLIEKCILGYCVEDHPNDRFKVIWWEPKINGGVWWSDLQLECYPTHWQPLPVPPAKGDTP